MRIRFGVTDTPPCPNCKNPMRLSRRTPHSKLGYAFELQTFTCRVCQYEIERSADELGDIQKRLLVDEERIAS